MSKPSKQSKAEEVREFLTSFNDALEKDGFRLRTVHFDRNDDGVVTNVRLSYDEKGKEASHAD